MEWSDVVGGEPTGGSWRDMVDAILGARERAPMLYRVVRALMYRFPGVVRADIELEHEPDPVLMMHLCDDATRDLRLLTMHWRWAFQSQERRHRRELADIPRGG